MSATPPSSSGTTPLCALRGVSKTFGAFTANDAIDLDIWPGEIHALLGENGAGKSTLVKMLYGLLAPTSGTIAFEGNAVALRSPEDARARGVGMVFQHFSLFDNLTVGENVAIVLPKSERLSGLPRRLAEVADRYGIALDADRPVWTLSAGERQRIEIARCLLQNPHLVILDEPTSVLTPQEAETLFVTLERLKSEKRALLYISHRLDEVRRLCDRATILRRGKVVGTCDPRAESARSLAALMVGTTVHDVKTNAHRGDGAARLALHGLSLASPDLHGVDLADVSLTVRAGEILGIAGIAGNGQAELFAALSGESLSSPDAIRFDGLPVGMADISARRRRDAAFVPEERNGHAAAGALSLADNVVLTRHATGSVAKAGIIDTNAARREADAIMARFDVRASGVDAPARTLSGGNLQKFVVGREILRDPAILVVDQPTWGVDAAAAATIRQALIDRAEAGAAVLVISQDLDELFEIADRIAVLHAGRLSDPIDARTTTREAVGLLMGGAHPERAITDEAAMHAT